MRTETFGCLILQPINQFLHAVAGEYCRIERLSHAKVVKCSRDKERTNEARKEQEEELASREFGHRRHPCLRPRVPRRFEKPPKCLMPLAVAQATGEWQEPAWWGRSSRSALRRDRPLHPRRPLRPRS